MEETGDVGGMPHPLQVRREVLLDGDLADRRADAGDGEPVRGQDLLGRAELIAVEVEDIDVPGAAELQVPQSELGQMSHWASKSGDISSANPVRIHTANLLMTEPSTEEPRPVSHADQQRHQLLPLVSAASSFFRLGASVTTCGNRLSAQRACPGLPYVLHLRPRRHPRRRHQSPKGVQAVNNIIENSTTGVTTPEPVRLSRVASGQPRRSAGSDRCTSGSATSTAPTRPGTPPMPPTPTSGGSRPSPAGARTWRSRWPLRTASTR